MLHMEQKSYKEEIVLELLRGDNHIRGIAKNLEISHMTVLRKLNELQKDNIVDAVSNGKNKTFFIKKNSQAKNQVYSAELYKLKKFLDNNSDLAIIFEDLKKIVKKGVIVLFGSYAKGKEKKESDIDIYMGCATKKTKQSLQEMYSKFSIKMGKFDLGSPLEKEIIKNHIIIRGVEEFYEKTKFFE